MSEVTILSSASFFGFRVYEVRTVQRDARFIICFIDMLRRKGHCSDVLTNNYNEKITERRRTGVGWGELGLTPPPNS